MNAIPMKTLLGTAAGAPSIRQSPLIILPVAEVGAAAWNDFLDRTEGSLPTQLAGWDTILHKHYGSDCYFLVAQQAGVIHGVLPLYRVKSILLGDSLQSMSGALCVDTPAAAQALIDAADELAHTLRVDYLLLRDSRQPWNESGLEVIQAHRGVRLHLPTDRATAWRNLHRGLRKDFSYGKNKGVIQTTIGCTEAEIFYEFYLRFCHERGTPCFSKQFILDITHAFPERFNIAVGINNNKVVTGGFNLIHRKIVFGIWGGALYGYIKMMPNHHIYWAAIENAIELGFEQFDIGRSPYPSSQFEFKERWCDESYPIYQLFRVYRGNLPSMLNINQAVQEKSEMSLVRKVWPKLPLPVARSLGPVIRRHIPFG